MGGDFAPRRYDHLPSSGQCAELRGLAIRTLDLLKKGNSPTAQAARGAARYIEHASRHHRLLSADPSVTVQLGTDYKKGRGLRLQRDDEYRAPETISELAIPPVDGAAQMPKWVVSVLSCAAFFVRIAFAEAAVDDKPDGEEFDEAKPVLLVANPPLAVEVEMVEGERKGENGPNFAERGEGYLISQEAERFELNLEVLRDEDAEEFVFDAELGRGKGHRRGDGGGGGRGRGGRGRGGGRGGARKQPEEPEREVKILLRRPQSNDERSPHPNQSSLPPILEPRSVSEHLSPMPPVAQVRPIPEHPQPPPFEHMPLPPGHGSPPPPPGHGPPPPPPWHIRSPRGNMLPPRDHHGHSSPHSPDYRYAGSSDHPSPFAPDYHYFPRPPPDAFRGGRGRGGRGRGGPDGLRGLGGGPDGFRGHGGGRGRGGGFTLLQRPGPPPGPPPVAHPGDEPRVVLLHRPK